MILSGRDIQWYIQTGKLKIDPVKPEQFQQNGVDLILNDIRNIRGPFCLGCTREVFEIPDDLMAFVEIRSTWARRGFFLPPTIVDAGFRGNLTLEILRFDDNSIDPYQQRFAHLIFSKLTSPNNPYKGKYQGQTGITGALSD